MRACVCLESRVSCRGRASRAGLARRVLTVHLGKIRELKIQTPSIATHGARLDSTIKKTTIRALK